MSSGPYGPIFYGLQHLKSLQIGNHNNRGMDIVTWTLFIKHFPQFTEVKLCSIAITPEYEHFLNPYQAKLVFFSLSGIPFFRLPGDNLQ